MDEEFYWVELLSYREVADYNDGLVTTIAGESSDNVYKSWLTRDILPNIDGAEVIFRGEVKSEAYDELMVIKYPSGQAFKDFVLGSDDLADKMIYRLGGLDSSNSLLLATQVMLDGIPDVLLQPPNEEDLSPDNFIFIDTFRFRDREAMAEFDELSAPIKAKNGFRAAGWLEVKSTALFEFNEPIDEIRFEFVPSFGDWGKLLTDETVPAIWEKRTAALDQDISVSARLSADDNYSTLFNLYN